MHEVFKFCSLYCVVFKIALMWLAWNKMVDRYLCRKNTISLLQYTYNNSFKCGGKSYCFLLLFKPFKPNDFLSVKSVFSLNSSPLAKEQLNQPSPTGYFITFHFMQTIGFLYYLKLQVPIYIVDRKL